jgi:hypothetical protein
VKLLYKGKPVHGELTTDHSQSSYGQPVLVLDDGTALGPGDLPGARDILEASVAEMKWALLLPV